MIFTDPEHWRLRLIELITVLRISQRKFADDTGIDPTYVSRLLYEPGKRGRKKLGLSNMAAIKKAYQLSPGWFELQLGEELPSKAFTGNFASPNLRPQKLTPDSAYKQTRLQQALQAMEQMDPYQLDQAVRIIETLVGPKTLKN